MDITALLTPVSQEAPSGPDLSSEQEYTDLFKAAEGTPEVEVGSVRIDAADPDFRALREGCVSLLRRSRDLRPAVLLVPALLKTEGVPGLRDALELIRGLLQSFWPTAHPQLDPADPDSVVDRMMALSALAVPLNTVGDHVRIQQRLREAPLVVSRQLGPVSLRLVALAKGEAAPREDRGETRPDPKLIDAAFEDVTAEDMQAASGALGRCLEAVKGIEAFLAQQEPGRAVSLAPLRQTIAEAQKLLGQHLSRRGYGEAAAQGPEAGEAGSEGGRGMPTGEIRSPDDVRLAIDRIIRYYERSEPSSPVPIMLRRVERMVSMSFVDIVRELAPESMDRLEMITGAQIKPQT